MYVKMTNTLQKSQMCGYIVMVKKKLMGLNDFFLHVKLHVCILMFVTGYFLYTFIRSIYLLTVFILIFILKY